MAFESSCDGGSGIVEDGQTILANVVASQVQVISASRWVPEVASRHRRGTNRSGDRLALEQTEM